MEKSQLRYVNKHGLYFHPVDEVIQVTKINPKTYEKEFQQIIPTNELMSELAHCLKGDFETNPKILQTIFSS